MSRLGKNILYNVVGQLALVLLGLFAVKYVFRELGPDALGVIYFSITLNVVLTGVLQKGVHSVTVREISLHHAGQPAYARAFIRTGSSLCWGAYLLLAALVYMSAPAVVEHWISLQTLDPASATGILQILGVATLSALPRAFYASLLRGLQRMEFNNAIDVSATALQQAGTIVILSHADDLYAIAYWIATCQLLSVLAHAAVSARLFSVNALVPGYSAEVMRRNWRFGAMMTAVSVVSTIQTQAEKIVLSTWLPIAALGYYAVAYGVLSKVGIVSGAVASAALPALSILASTGDRAGLLGQYRKLQDCVCYATAPMFAAVQFASLPLFTFLFDRPTAEALFAPVAFLCAGFYLNGVLNLQYQICVAAGKPDIALRASVYGLTVVPLAVLLIAQFGLAGAGLSWFVYNILIAIYIVPRVTRECIGMPPWTWYADVSKVLALVGATYGTAWAVLVSLHTYSVLSLGIAYVAATAVFLAGGYFLISEELTRSLAALARGLLRHDLQHAVRR